MQDLNELVSNPELLKRAESVLNLMKKYREDSTNLLYYVGGSTIRNEVAASFAADTSLEALNVERQAFDELNVLEFLQENGYIRGCGGLGYVLTDEYIRG